MDKTYQYTANDNKTYDYVIKDPSIIERIDRAMKDFLISKSIINAYASHTWSAQLRAYHMGVDDRQIRANLKPWQSNIPFGLTRSFVDVFISTLTENPITWVTKGITKKGVENQDSIRRALTTSADVTGYQGESRIMMNEGLKVGMFSAEIGIMSDVRKKKYSTILRDEFGQEKVEEREFEEDIGGYPYARHISVFNLFPDPVNQDPRYIAKRDVLNHKALIKTYGDLIEDDANLLKGSMGELVKFLVKNENGADKYEYDQARDSVHRSYNIKNARFSVNSNVNNPRATIDQTVELNDSDFRKELIEIIYVPYDEEIVLFANNYPVYVGPNKFGFIPFEALSATDPRYTIDCEGVGYKIGGLSDTMDSFMNNYLDSARSIATPNFVALKNAFLDIESLKGAAPGTIIFSETEAGAQTLRRLDKGTISDFDILDIVIKIASQITGISEYNLGISARERTATGALATTQSSLKRLSPFLMAFNVFSSRIAQKFLKLMKEHWKDPMYVAAAGIDEPELMLSNINLDGLVDISLQMDSMQSAIDEFAYKKLVEIWTQTQGRGLIKENEVVRQMFRNQGLAPDRFVPPDAPEISVNPIGALPPDFDAGTIKTPSPVTQALTEMTSPQANLGNGGEGQPA